MKKLRVVFMGTPEFGVPTLEKLIETYDVVGVVCQPDKLVGRHQVLEACPTKKIALEHNIPVFQPVKIRNDYQNIIDTNPDIIVTAAYGQIVNMELLDYPKYRSINIHGSMLPKYRGASPIQEAIKNGDTLTGVTIMYMEKGMDTGDILAFKEVTIEENDNSETLFKKMSIVGRDLVMDVIEGLVNNTIIPIKQDDEKATYCKMITKDDEILDFTKDAKVLHNIVRAYNPNPVASAIINDDLFKIYETRVSEVNHNQEVGKFIQIDKRHFGITCGNNTILEVIKLKPAGKNLQTNVEFINGSLKKYLK